MHYVSKASRSLEDMFFAKREAELQRQRKELEKMNETKEELAKVSAIKDDMVLDKLVKLDVRPETVATLALVPLVQIAWADGEADEDEKQAVLEAVKESNGYSSVDHKILDVWLSKKPDPALYEAWKHYIAAICEKMSKEEIEHFRTALLGQARSIAQASGGFLGLTSPVSEEESAMIRKMEEAFKTPA